MAQSVGRPGNYYPVTGGATSLLASGTGTLGAGGSASVTTTEPLIGRALFVSRYSTQTGLTGSAGSLTIAATTSGTSFKVKSSTTNDRNAFYWEIRSI